MTKEEEYTAEEQAALTEMMSAPSDVAEEPKPEPEPEAPEATPEEPEKVAEEGGPGFKSSQTEKPPEGFVPHGALHAEREKRKALEAKVEALEQAVAPKVKEETPKWVDPLIDPEGFKKWNDWNTKQITDRLDGITTQSEQAAKAQERMQEAQRFEAEFAATTQDYGEAVKFLHAHRVTELTAQGLSAAEINARIAADAGAIFDSAKAIGWNPAEMLYQTAIRAGYTKAAKQNGLSEAEKVVALDKAQKMTEGVGKSGGGEQSGKLTLAQLADMSEAELAKVDPAEIRRVMGG